MPTSDYFAELYLNGASGYVFRWNTVTNCTTACVTVNGAPNTVIDSNTINGQTGNLGESVPSWAVSVSWGSPGTQLTHNLLENIDSGGLVVQDGPNDPANNNINMSYNLLENGWGVHGDDLGCLYMYDAAG
jgi:hypothetical protein